MLDYKPQGLEHSGNVNDAMLSTLLRTADVIGDEPSHSKWERRGCYSMDESMHAEGCMAWRKGLRVDFVSQKHFPEKTDLRPGGFREVGGWAGRRLVIK